MQGKFTFLGTGASMGVPLIGCKCSVCLSQSQKDKRYRSSGLIELNDKKILLDVGPDFRTQALKHEIEHIDALFLTHIHADHIAGIDDLRLFYFRSQKKMPCYLSIETLEDLKVRYHYIFRPIQEVPTISAQLELQVLEQEYGDFAFLGAKFGYLTFFQGGVKVTGYRIGNLAYLTDIKEYSDDIFSHLKGIDHLIVSAIGFSGSKVHFSLEDAVNFADKVGAKNAYITHLSHEFDHEKTNQMLPSGRQLAHDGLCIDFNGVL